MRTQHFTSLKQDPRWDNSSQEVFDGLRIGKVNTEERQTVYVCPTNLGLVRIVSEDFWASLEEFRDYEGDAPASGGAGVTIRAGHRSVVQVGSTTVGASVLGTTSRRSASLSAMSACRNSRSSAQPCGTRRETVEPLQPILLSERLLRRRMQPGTGMSAS